ncbi:MAG: HYR domain-containing protein [Lewinellaceae bacterium]|nr:HYR domain-containing protein [Saprospiraceae bacterium]MCB9343113.1 HYR domain-containing protein [Lewinellaceae bacterium]
MNRLLHVVFFLFACSVIGKAFSPDPLPAIDHPTPSADTIPPMIFCPPSQIINLAPQRCDTVLFYSVNATDDQGQVSLSLLDGLASGSPFPAGATVCIWKATDQAGNTATCSFTMSVLEPMPPPQCRSQTSIFLDANCNKTINPFEILIGGPYGCPSHYQVEADKEDPPGNGPWVSPTFNAANINLTYQVRVTSLFTGTTCTGTVIIKDNTPPVINAQTINVPCALPLDHLTPSFLHDSLGLAAGKPVITDACTNGMISVSFVDVLQNLPCDDTTIISGIIQRIWTATDLHGNSATKEQIINRTRLIQDVQIPQDAALNCDDPNTGDDATGRPFVVFMNRQYELTPASYCEFDAQYFDTIQPGSCAGSYTLQRTWKIYDACLPLSPSNPKIGVQNIVVNDNVAPVFQCPAEIILDVVDNNCTATVNLPDLYLSDNCSAVTSVQASWMENGSPKMLSGTIDYQVDSSGVDTIAVLGTSLNFPIGTVSMHYSITDECGNVGDCNFTLKVGDDTPPTAVCDNLLLTSLQASGYLSIPSHVLDNGSTDNCTTPSFKAKLDEPNPCSPDIIFGDTIFVCCHNIGDTLKGVLRVYDITVPLGDVASNYASGHYSDCNFRIKVTGTNPPKCTAPADITISCEAFDPSLESYGGLLSQSCSVDSVSPYINYSQFDTLCSRGTLRREFQVFDSNGSMSECSQKIVVNYEQDYFIRFPDDKVVSACDTSGYYGEPQFFGKECELMNATYTEVRDDNVSNACYKIERNWRIVNWCAYDPNLPLTDVPNPTPIALETHPDNLPGPVVSPIQTNGDPWRSTIAKLQPSDQSSTNFSIYYDANTNGYKYTQIIYVVDNVPPIAENCADTIKVEDQTTNDPDLWNASYWLDPLHLSFDMCEAPSNISITATDACAGGKVTINYELSLDLNSDGIRETIVKSASLPPANTIYYNNTGGPGEARQYDFRSVPPEQKYKFAKQDIISGNRKTTYIRFNTQAAPDVFLSPQLPYGNHKVKWIITDECGNKTECERIVRIRDGKAPVVICLQGLSNNILPTKEIDILANDVVQYTEDNCTPNQMLVLGIRKAGTGNGFPLNINGNPQQKVTFTCDELGVNPIELWSRDRSGNAGFCQTSIIIQDNNQACVTDPGPPIIGKVTTEEGDGVQSAKMVLGPPSAFQAPGPPPNATVFTDTLGNYDFGTSFNSLPSNSLHIKPEKDDNPLNGLTTYDLVLISKHILGIEALGSPYKLIAADANKSNSITTFDIVEFRKLILGIYQELPNNTSWRFVDKNYVFPNPQVPFQPPFPDTILVSAIDHDFVGVKIGDVNNSVVPNLRGAIDERSAGTVFFDVTTESAGKLNGAEVTDVHFSTDQALLGCQFTLNMDGVDLLELLPGENLSLDNFALFPEKNAITMACEKEGSMEFTLRCKTGSLDELPAMILLNSNITRAEAYQKTSNGDERFDLALRFPEQKSFELFQNHPNPFSESTDILFYLPEATDATLSIHDAQGRVIFTQTAFYEKGLSSIHLEPSAIEATGVLYYKLETPNFSDVKKMMRL